jgi:hypothetical protein
VGSANACLRENGPFLVSFPYVCPEPVLVKCSFSYIYGSKRPFLLSSPEASCDQSPIAATDHPKETHHSLFEVSLCLSRACLGKKMHFIYKWHRKKWRFPTDHLIEVCILGQDRDHTTLPPELQQRRREDMAAHRSLCHTHARAARPRESSSSSSSSSLKC